VINYNGYGKVRNNNPKVIRNEIRQGKWKKTTAGLCSDYVQANLVILPKEIACPIIDITEVGSSVPKLAAPDSDLRFDIPRYNIYREGNLIEETDDIKKYWQAVVLHLSRH